MHSKYRMQIVDHRTGEVVEYEPGLTVEIDFVDECVQRILDLWNVLPTDERVSEQAETAIRTGINEVIHDLKAKVPPRQPR